MRGLPGILHTIEAGKADRPVWRLFWTVEEAVSKTVQNENGHIPNMH
jgi:hypothetical protein